MPLPTHPPIHPPARPPIHTRTHARTRPHPTHHPRLNPILNKVRGAGTCLEAAGAAALEHLDAGAVEVGDGDDVAGELPLVVLPHAGGGSSWQERRIMVMARPTLPHNQGANLLRGLS